MQRQPYNYELQLPHIIQSTYCLTHSSFCPALENCGLYVHALGRRNYSKGDGINYFKVLWL